MLPRNGHRIPLLVAGDGLLLGSQGAAEVANRSESKNVVIFPGCEPTPELEGPDPCRRESDVPKALDLDGPGSEELPLTP